MSSNETNYYMQTYLHLLTSLKRFGRYTQTVRSSQVKSSLIINFAAKMAE